MLTKKIMFFKTHNALCTIDGHKFTDKNNTVWKISPIPLGGYVKIKGLDSVFQKKQNRTLKFF